jgi:glycosyltransferase involved in cell wall biosynthesis
VDEHLEEKGGGGGQERDAAGAGGRAQLRSPEIRDMGGRNLTRPRAPIIGHPMNVVHVTPFYEPAWAYGGMVRAVAGLCRALAARGHQVTVVTALLDAAHPRLETVAGVRVRRVPALLKRVLAPWAPGLGRLIRAEFGQAHLVHIHGLRSGMAVATYLACESMGRPWVLQPHGSWPHHDRFVLPKFAFDGLWGGRMLHLAHSLVAVSQAEARDLAREAHVVANGVESVGSAEMSDRRGFYRVLFVGNDSPQKRSDLLPELLAELPAVRLQVVGRFGRRFAGRFGPIGHRVTLSGPLEGQALASAYASADLLVHPAVDEAFGLAPFEAALLGTPAVVAGGHGCGEWFARAGGCVVAPDDPVALAEAAQARLSDRAAGEREAAAVADFARRELTWDRAAQAMETVYGGVLKAWSEPAAAPSPAAAPGPKRAAG